MPIGDWMPTLKTKVEEVSGITQVHTYLDLPAAIGAWPTAIILPREGHFEYGSGGPQKAVHQLRIAVYCAGQILPQGYAVAVPLIELIRDKLAANFTLGGLVAHIQPADGAPTYDGPGAMRYANKQHLGFIMNYRVKENEGGTYTVGG